MKEILHKAKFVISFASSSCFAARDCAGKIARELLRTIQELSPVDILPWFSIMYHLGD
jgi:hypothetical protein